MEGQQTDKRLDLTVQVRLLDDLEEVVVVTQTRMQAAAHRVTQVMKRSGAGKLTCAMVLLMAALVGLIILLLAH